MAAQTALHSPPDSLPWVYIRTPLILYPPPNQAFILPPKTTGGIPIFTPTQTPKISRVIAACAYIDAQLHVIILKNNLMSGAQFGYIIHDGISHWAKNVSELMPPGEYIQEDHELPTPMLITGVTFEKDLVIDLAHRALRRGPDAVGIFDGSDHETFWQDPSLPYMSGRIHDLLFDVSSRMFLIGNCLMLDFHQIRGRALVHPIHYGGIYMAHIGTLNDYRYLWTQHIAKPEMMRSPIFSGICPTDPSEVLIQLLYRYRDVDQVMAFSAKDDYWALVYFDSNSGELHISVKGAPFYTSERDGTLYWCTEEFPDSERFEGHMVLSPFNGMAVP